MKNLLKILFWGFLLWMGVFAVSFLIFPLKQANSPFFETLMAVSLTGGTVLFSMLLFKNLEEDYLKTGIQVGFIWFVENILFDLPLFSYGSMAMPWSNYFQDIGFTYLIIPIVTYGFGWILENKLKKMDDHIHLKDAENEEVS
jgi:hypothetical protein